MSSAHHKEILKQIRKHAGKPVKDPFLNSYLGNDHVRYSITAPAMHKIAKSWMRAHKQMSPEELAEVLTGLVEGKSCTEKMMAGMIMDYSAKSQRDFDPKIFDRWLDHLVGWVEVDTCCTGDFPATQLPAHWPKWKSLIIKLSKDKNINKRRASLVLFCSPVGRVRDERMGKLALKTVDRLKKEKEVLITKAISWVLRSMIKHYRDEVSAYLSENEDSLPRIAVRETSVKLKTGKKTRTKKKQKKENRSNTQRSDKS